MAKKKKKQTTAEQILDRAYYRDKESDTYYGPLRVFLKRYADKYGRKIVTDWHRDQLANQLLAGSRRKYPRRITHTSGINVQFQFDLAEIGHIARQNRNFRYLLVGCDILSRKAYVAPLLNKTASNVTNHVEKILSSLPKMVRLVQTDHGTEFNGLGALGEKLGFTHFRTYNMEQKAAICERLIRTLKMRIYRYLIANNTLSFVDDLPALVEAYNNTHNTVIDMAPNSVNESNVHQVLHTSYENRARVHRRKPGAKLRPGDFVRVRKHRKTFDKGYLPSAWSDRYYVIDGVLSRQPPLYRIRDGWDATLVEGSFYESELQKLPSEPSVFRVEKIVERKPGMVKVRFIDYDKQDDMWIAESLIKEGSRLK